MLKFEDLDTEKQRNEILKGIHNQLAQINKWLEVGIALYAKLSADDVDELRCDADDLKTHFKGILYGNRGDVGYSKERGLYKVSIYSDKETYKPLGEYDRTAPIDEGTGLFKED